MKSNTTHFKPLALIAALASLFLCSCASSGSVRMLSSLDAQHAAAVRTQAAAAASSDYGDAYASALRARKHVWDDREELRRDTQEELRENAEMAGMVLNAVSGLLARPRQPSPHSVNPNDPYPSAPQTVSTTVCPTTHQ